MFTGRVVLTKGFVANRRGAQQANQLRDQAAFTLWCGSDAVDTPPHKRRKCP
jgi:hypothetical protein